MIATVFGDIRSDCFELSAAWSTVFFVVVLFNRYNHKCSAWKSVFDKNSSQFFLLNQRITTRIDVLISQHTHTHTRKKYSLPDFYHTHVSNKILSRDIKRMAPNQVTKDLAQHLKHSFFCCWWNRLRRIERCRECFRSNVDD